MISLEPPATGRALSRQLFGATSYGNGDRSSTRVGLSSKEDIVLRSDIERKRLLVETKAQGADERESDHAEESAAEEPSPLAASTARAEETGKAACDHQEVPRGTN